MADDGSTCRRDHASTNNGHAPHFDTHKLEPYLCSSLPCVQGGPVGQYDYSFQQEQHLFAAAGYVVLSVNPRGSSGRGQAFCQALFADCKMMLSRSDLAWREEYQRCRGRAGAEGRAHRCGLRGWARLERPGAALRWRLVL